MNDSALIQQLEKSGQYKVIERLNPPDFYTAGKPATARIGIVIDVEATGLDTVHDKIIELGFIVFEYDAGTGLIYRILHSYGGFEDPGEPLAEIIRQITGISDDMVAGQKLDDAEINVWLQQADLIIAHNAAYDRQMLERRFPVISQTNWACTFNDINWMEEEIASLKLDYIAYKMGYFFDGHRAVNDAQATLHLLSKPLPQSGTLAMSALLAQAREKSRRYFAVAAPFDKKDDLKARGYRWMADFAYSERGKQRKGVWSKSVSEATIEAEQQWLTDVVYGGKSELFTFKDVSAKDRYSIRELSAG
ncbi:DNA polymerase III subunit epsilon [Mariprofundus micogutta]|uniref:DNA polymerase III subunit epsilon n=1 Tax=Mariprofundus micogutta TaxID=1921010 RepID=A0A1L8CNA0_9PROT|nr:3'-5' exonuclease [Mariprofundus micogutta]GAV20391.1 DNA polymerase III subunit epsilon [Mariprofundus micogutta]